MNEQILKQIEKDITALAKTLFKSNAKRALNDGKAFLAETENQIALWMKQLAAGKITQKNFESLMRGEKDLAEMEALKQAGLSKVAIDTFTSGVIDIIINAALGSV